MKNCLITKLNGVIDNPSLIRLDELKVFFSENGNGKGYVASQIKMNVSGNVTITVRSMGNGVQVSSDKTNWGDTAELTNTTPTAYEATYIAYFKSNDGEGGYVAIPNKQKLVGLAYLDDLGNNTAGMIYVLNDNLKYAPIKYCTVVMDYMNLTDYPYLTYTQKRMGVSSTYKDILFTKLRYDRTNRGLLTKVAEINNQYFEVLSECVEYLEDCATVFNHPNYTNTMNIHWGNAFIPVVPLTDDRLAEYRQRLYDSLVALLTTLSPTPMTRITLFGVAYTWDSTNSKLLADGQEVIID